MTLRPLLVASFLVAAALPAGAQEDPNASADVALRVTPPTDDPAVPRLTWQPTREEVIGGFAQGGAGNCTSVAVIKAAIIAFGPRPVFASVRADADGYLITMRDAVTEYRLTHEEFAVAPSLSGFIERDSAMTAYANFLYAAMVKRVQLADPARTLVFEDAAERLNEGEHWLKGPFWLGLDGFVLTGKNSKIPWVARPGRFLEAQEAGIAKRWNHTWFASHGLHDRRGKAGRPFAFMSGAIALDVARIREEIPLP